MIRHIIFTAAFSIFSGGLTSADILVKDGQKIAFLGDSITANGWAMSDGYVQLTVAGLKALGVNVTPIPGGVSGNTSRDMLARLKSDVLDHKPDWMTLSCGVNDILAPNPCNLEEYSKNITAIVDQAQAAGIKVLIMTPTPLHEEENDYNKMLTPYLDFLHQFAKQRQLPVAEENAAFWAAIKNGGNPRTVVLTADGIHPATEGNIVMARTLLAGFGASAAQVNQAAASWAEIKASSPYRSEVTAQCNGNITLKQYEALKVLAVNQKCTLTQILDNLFEQAHDEKIQRHQKDANQNTGALTQETQSAFLAKVQALAK